MPSKSARKLQRGKFRRISRVGGGRWSEYIPFSIGEGEVFHITANYLAERPNRANFRPTSMEVEAVGGYVPPSTTNPQHNIAWYAPAAIQFWFGEADTNKSSSLAPRMVSNIPRRFSILNPPSADWYAYDVPPTTAVAQLQHICMGPTYGNHQYIRGIIRINLEFQHEILPAVCPSLWLNSSEDPRQIAARAARQDVTGHSSPTIPDFDLLPEST